MPRVRCVLVVHRMEIKIRVRNVMTATTLRLMAVLIAGLIVK
jgi:hypothetical protein